MAFAFNFMDDTFKNQLKEIIETELSKLCLNFKSHMSVNDLSRYLELTPDYIRTLTHNREIPFYKPKGKKIYFKKEEIDEWIESSRMATADEIRKEAKLYRKKV